MSGRWLVIALAVICVELVAVAALWRTRRKIVKELRRTRPAVNAEPLFIARIAQLSVDPARGGEPERLGLVLTDITARQPVNTGEMLTRRYPIVPLPPTPAGEGETNHE